MRKKWMAVIALCIISICAVLTGVGESVLADNHQKIRVGYVEYADFIYWDEERESYSGYGVSYLNEIVNHTEWEIEYVGGNWEECLSRLRNGEIDLLCPAQKTDERMAEFLFSMYPIGTTETVVYVAEEEEDLFFEDYDYLQGKRVGLICSSAQQMAFRRFAKENQITYTEIPYESGIELFSAVDSGEVDIFVTSSMTIFPEYQIVARFEAAPFYFMLNPDHRDLLDELNETVGTIKINDYTFDTRLYNEYFGAEQFTLKPLFTREEVAFIEQAEPIKIGMLSGYFPYSSNEEGQMCGICEELVKEISRISGMEFEIVPITDGIPPKDFLMEKNGVDMVGGMMRSQEYLEDSELQVSDVIFDFEFIIIAQKDKEINEINGMRVAIPYDFPYMRLYIEKNYPDAQVLLYEDNDACMEAIKQEQADITIQNEYVCSYLLQNPKQSSLAIVKNISLEGNACFVASNEIDPKVMSIINKTMKCISTANKNRIINEYTIANSYQMSLMEFLYAYRKQLIFYCLVFGLIVFIIYFIYGEKKKAIQEKKQAELLKNQLEISRLTGLYNKHAFYQNAENLMHSNPEKKYLIIVFDIEKFKIINDLFGMAEGDRLLQYFARKLEQIVDGKGIAGYRGADNFVVCMENTEDCDIEAMEQELHDYINEFPIDIKVQLCMGVYEVIRTDVPVSLMCDRANMAAASVKGNELKHVAFYDDSMRQKLLNDQVILNEMQDALEQKQFQVYIQPKCRVDSEELIGGEALVRWIHPQKGVIAPGEFIPLFEKNGFITKLDFYVWEETCRIIRKWKDEGIKTVPLSVNISRLNFYLPDFENVFEKLLEKYHLTPDDLYLEVTESAYTNESDVIFNQLSQLQEKRFTILMDDFGSGYSSLNMLQEAPVDVLKLDMKFLLGNDEKKRSEIILESVIKMAKQLGFKIIAEGVESREQCEMLLRLGCHFGQGYYFSRPISADEFEDKYLKKQSAAGESN